MDDVPAPPQPPRKPKREGIPLVLDLDIHKRLKKIAKLKKISHQTMLKQFVGEKLYEAEKGLGVI
ncbi:hypothetical protein [Deinococcus sp.]|uniref:hypothetical protein n=1 Tax=Deinococcus sp. TaxID=47478 RepID=UPI0025E8C3F5|nr:hypothetical protein [Deinococcus sp.]